MKITSTTKTLTEFTIVASEVDVDIIMDALVVAEVEAKKSAERPVTTSYSPEEYDRIWTAIHDAD